MEQPSETPHDVPGAVRRALPRLGKVTVGIALLAAADGSTLLLFLAALLLGSSVRNLLGWSRYVRTGRWPALPVDAAYAEPGGLAPTGHA